MAEVCNFLRRPLKIKNIRKRSCIEDGEEEEKEEEITLIMKKKRRNSNSKLEFSMECNDKSKENRFCYESSNEIQIESDNGATAILETETEHTKDGRALREKALNQAKLELKGKENEKIYRGIQKYTDYKAGFRREKAGGAHGPLRASSYIRVSSKIDYQPDLCKDYKETGYCGFGDSCKFMHDRGDYKSSFQIEKEYEEAEKQRKRR